MKINPLHGLMIQCPDAGRDSESVQQLKNVMSTGDFFVEVKKGMMVFDSPLLIITSNIELMQLAVRCGEDNHDPSSTINSY